MKKSLLSFALVLGVAGAYAQDLTSKKGEPILPESGDWAIAIDAVPFLNYAGGFLSNAGATAPNFNWTDGSTMTIMGKMFKDEKTAYRAMVRLGFGSDKETAMIGDAAVTTPPTFPALPAMKEDEFKFSSRSIGLGAGIEMRRGKTRLQGYYGADAMIWLQGGKSSYTYGNALSSTVAVSTTTTTDFGNNLTTDTYGNAARVTESKAGSTFGFGVRGFIGAEYFIFPKISIGGEYGWGLGISSTGASSTTTESVDGGSGSVGTQTIEQGKSSGFGIDTDINKWWSPQTGGGSLFLALHF